MPQTYNCKKCNFLTIVKFNFDRHCKTNKHIIINNEKDKKNLICDNCNKKYSYNSLMSFCKDNNIEFSNDPTNADIILSSVFGGRWIDGEARHIMYSGEVYLRGFCGDNSILLHGVDDGEYQPHFRLPQWMTNINFWPGRFNRAGGPGEIILPLSLIEKFCEPLPDEDVEKWLQKKLAEGKAK